jgi:pantothenate kinase
MLWSQKQAEDTALLPIEETGAMLPMDGFHLYCSQLDALLPIEETGAMLPMDGFHLYCSQLDAMEVCSLSSNHISEFCCILEFLTLLCM